MKKISIRHISIVLTCLIPTFIFGQGASLSANWADSTLKRMTIDERIGQLFMIAAYSNKTEADYKAYEASIKQFHIGGILFMQGDVKQQVVLTNRFQRASQIPLFIAIDGEWGLSMRLKNTVRYPRQMTLGAIKDEYLIYRMGYQIGREMQRMGIHINFAPDVDVNTNPLNPVINTRSFGEYAQDVARKGSLYMKGLQDAGMIAVAKHFPGHGNTSVDSHLDLPKVDRSIQELQEDLCPFKKLIDDGVKGVITAHLWVPALDSIKRASSLSPKIVQGILRDSMHFKGLIFTDGMGMKGVGINSDKIYRDAILAGNDVILFPPKVKDAIDEVKGSWERGELSDSIINERCKRILVYKYKHGLSVPQQVRIDDVEGFVNSAEARALNEQLVQRSITVLKNNHACLPISDGLLTQNQTIITLGAQKANVFEKTVRFYKDVSSINLPLKPTNSDIERVLRQVKSDSLVIVAIYSGSIHGEQAITDETLKMLETLSQTKHVILSLFTNPYTLSRLKAITKNLDAIVMGYSLNDLAQSAVAQVIYGGLAASASIPITALKEYPAGTGVTTSKIRMGIALPESQGVSSEALSHIDSVVKHGISEKAMPGCQVLVARNGEVIFNKSYGYYTYDKKQAVRDSDLYDIASVTKIVATLPAVMKLVESNQLHLKDTLASFFDELKGTDKGSISIEMMLRHESGFPAFIPMVNHFIDVSKLNGKPLYSARKSTTYTYELGRHFYGNKDRSLMTNFFSNTNQNGYSILVAKGVFAKPIVKDSIWQAIVDVPLGTKKYLYSDLNFMVLQKIVEKITEQPLDKYCNNNFWAGLNGNRTTYIPVHKFSTNRIVPTEQDQFYRKQLLQGYVHDLNAALMGGVSGHAGVFSSASDLAKVMQMYLNGGEYGGKRYFGSAIIKQFSETTEINNRRGLGFDKPELDSSKTSPVTNLCSPLSFGHTGFTGAITWVDPKYNLVYVFLSNRVYPDAYNQKLVRMGIRTEIQKVIYNAIEFGERKITPQEKFSFISPMVGIKKMDIKSYQLPPMELKLFCSEVIMVSNFSKSYQKNDRL